MLKVKDSDKSLTVVYYDTNKHLLIKPITGLYLLTKIWHPRTNTGQTECMRKVINEWLKGCVGNLRMNANGSWISAPTEMFPSRQGWITFMEVSAWECHPGTAKFFFRCILLSQENETVCVLVWPRRTSKNILQALLVFRFRNYFISSCSIRNISKCFFAEHHILWTSHSSLLISNGCEVYQIDKYRYFGEGKFTACRMIWQQF